MNKVFMIGRLTDKPESKQTPTGVSVANFKIAVNRRFDKDTADFFTVIAWRGLADNCARYLEKGQQVAVAGSLQTRSYDDKNGVKRYVTEIQADDVEFLARAGGAKQQTALEEIMGGALMDDEDLPF